jgi:hypothetical protein|tara:strand:- start:424 stop:603 length:180 start_codon:yes stop_codon:yes gene_type:complete
VLLTFKNKIMDGFDEFKVRDLKTRLEKETKLDKQKMIYMWVKQGVITLKEFNNLIFHCL